MQITVRLFALFLAILLSWKWSSHWYYYYCYFFHRSLAELNFNLDRHFLFARIALACMVSVQFAYLLFPFIFSHSFFVVSCVCFVMPCGNEAIVASVVAMPRALDYDILQLNLNEMRLKISSRCFSIKSIDTSIYPYAACVCIH